MKTSCTAAAVVAFLLLPSVGRACATCACGDPTLTSMGTEQPFSGRLRLATSLRAWGQTVGDEALDAVTLRELRMDVSAAYAPLPWLFLSATVPLQARTLQDVSLARESGWGLGDAAGERAGAGGGRAGAGHAPARTREVLGNVAGTTSVGAAP